MPPSLADWVPDDHLVWTVLGAVEKIDLDEFYAAYRANGQGRAAYDPGMMVALLLYGYSRGNRSSRGIERACREDVAYKVITAMAVPDHSTIAEFRRRHQAAIGELFVEVLSLCQEAGLVSVGVVAVDGTKVKASASRDRNRSYEGSSRRSSMRPSGSTARRTTVTALRGAMSCRSGFAREKAGVLRWPRPSSDLMRRRPSRITRPRRNRRLRSSSTSSVRWRRGMVVRAGCAKVAAGSMSGASESSNLSPGHASSVWLRPSAGWRRPTLWSAQLMRPMRPTTRARSAAMGDGSRPRLLTRCQRCPRAEST